MATQMVFGEASLLWEERLQSGLGGFHVILLLLLESTTAFLSSRISQSPLSSQLFFVAVWGQMKPSVARSSTAQVVPMHFFVV